MMRSPTAALLWEIWRKHRWTITAVALLTFLGRVVAFFERRQAAAGGDPPPLTDLCAMLAFLLLFSVFNYTDSASRGLGQFPRRLFTLPVSTLRLVAVPMLAAIASVEILYLFWMTPLSRDESTNALFVPLLLAAWMVFYLTALWMLERTGSLRLIILGIIATIVLTIGLLPSPAEPVLMVMVAGGELIAFLLAWRHVARLRSGSSGSVPALESLGDRVRIARAPWRKPFTSPAAAHFWFEWRSSGLVLPALVSGQLLFLIMPISFVRSEAGDTLGLFFFALAAPIALAIPVGVAFSKPTFWSEDLRMPSFVAVRPISAEDLVAIKLQVAALSAALAWLTLLIFLAVWLSFWANLDSVSRLAIQVWAFHDQSVTAVYGIAALIAIAGMFVTWACLVCPMWIGLSGIRSLFVAMVAAIVLLASGAFVFLTDGWTSWLIDHPTRFALVAWTLAIAVIVKFWLAAYAWRGAISRYLRVYLPIWLAATASLVALGLVIVGIVRIYLPVDGERLQSVAVLLALLGMPLARIGLAPSSLARNRHRRS